MESSDEAIVAIRVYLLDGHEVSWRGLRDLLEKGNGGIEGSAAGYLRTIGALAGRCEEGRSTSMGHEPLDLAFAFFQASQEDGANDAEIAGRLEQARTAALLSIAESLSTIAAAAVDEHDDWSGWT
ncbi:hypothetical protein [Sinomonas atrocyanea]